MCKKFKLANYLIVGYPLISKWVAAFEKRVASTLAIVIIDLPLKYSPTSSITGSSFLQWPLVVQLKSN